MVGAGNRKQTRRTSRCKVGRMSTFDIEQYTPLPAAVKTHPARLHSLTCLPVYGRGGPTPFAAAKVASSDWPSLV